MAIAWVEHVVKWMSGYVFRLVPLLTLGMHLILAVLSDSRRREACGWKRLLVWCAYQLTDWGPVYVISNLFLETSPREKMIIAFWVPFLLLYLARPDNISAYSLEDIELWIRLSISVIQNLSMCIFVVFRFILTDYCAADGPLRWASGIMLFLAVCKYLESAFALRLSKLSRVRDYSTKNSIDLEALETYKAAVKTKDDKALLVAHGLLEICKGAFCDYEVDTDRDAVRRMFRNDWEWLCMVVEMELSLMYDILYTKAALVYTWHGYVIRLASVPLTALALLLFGVHCQEGMTRFDKFISYTLLSTTILLDMRWLFRAVVSSWAYSYFKHRPHSWLNHKLLCQGKWLKLRGLVASWTLSRLSLWLWTCDCGKESKSYRRWAGTFEERNLLDRCIAGDRDKQLHSIPRGVGLSQDHSRSSRSDIPDYLKELVFSNICEKLFPENPEPPPPPDPPRCPKLPCSCKGRQGWDCPKLPCYCYCKERQPVPPGRSCKGRQGWDCPKLQCYCYCYCKERQPMPPGPRQPGRIQVTGPGCPYWIEADHETAGMRIESARPYSYPEEQAAEEDQWRHEQVDQWIYSQTHLMSTRVTTANSNAQQAGEEFPPELQEVILIWHIATDVFLSRSTGECALRRDKAIKRMSDYMVFLVAKRRDMLPGLKLSSLYKTTEKHLKTIIKEARRHAPNMEKEELARWMADNMQNFPRRTHNGIVWKGTLLGRVLLSLVHPSRVLPPQQVTDTMEKHRYWTPAPWHLTDVTLKEMDVMLKYIMDAWVRLLMYASVRCSRDSHAKQLSRGGELTTLVWIVTEHADKKFVKKNVPMFFPPKE